MMETSSFASAAEALTFYAKLYLKFPESPPLLARSLREKIAAQLHHQVCSGGAHNIVLTLSGRVFTCGDNSRGQLGRTSDELSQRTFAEVTLPDSLRNEFICSAAGGSGHTVVLTTSGRVFTCGRNDYGELGRTSDENTQRILAEMTQPDSLRSEAFRGVAAGTAHTVVLTTSGRIFTCGDNDYGQLGRTSNENTRCILAEMTPPNSLRGEAICAVNAGAFHTVVLTTSGRVFTCGHNDHGQLGRTSSAHTRCILAEMTPPYSLLSGEAICAVAAGSYHTVVLTTSGRVFTCGKNNFGQLGRTSNENTQRILTEVKASHVPSNDNVIAVAAGCFYTVLLTASGHVLTCGANSDGQLGRTSDELSQRTFAEIMLPDSLRNESICAVDASSSFSTVLTTSGRVLTCGTNSRGQLGRTSDALTKRILADVDSRAFTSENQALTSLKQRLLATPYHDITTINILVAKLLRVLNVNPTSVSREGPRITRNFLNAFRFYKPQHNHLYIPHIGFSSSLLKNGRLYLRGLTLEFNQQLLRTPADSNISIHVITTPTGAKQTFIRTTTPILDYRVETNLADTEVTHIRLELENTRQKIDLSICGLFYVG
tara:strand:- start:23506 stop:25305 length:1800 start_codon:yes stop_codon:yes gene_type:complete